eukprot:602187-Prymnesium_polylepis.1
MSSCSAGRHAWCVATKSASGEASAPMAARPERSASTSVVPLPQNGSRMVPPSGRVRSRCCAATGCMPAG